MKQCASHSKTSNSSSLCKFVLWGLSAGWDDPVGVGRVKLHEFGEIKLGFLKDLNLLDEDILKRENLGALLCDSLTNLVTDAKRKYN